MPVQTDTAVDAVVVIAPGPVGCFETYRRRDWSRKFAGAACATPRAVTDVATHVALLRFARARLAAIVRVADEEEPLAEFADVIGG